MIFKRNRITLSAMTLCFYLFSQGGALPELHAAFTSAPIQENTSPYLFNIQIPEELGQVTQTLSNNGPVIVHIQEAHGDYGVQKNISAILKLLNENYGFENVLIEGSAFKLHAERLKLLSDTEANLKVLDDLAKESIVSGPELFLAENPAVSIDGIEKIDSYVRNGKAFQSVLRQRALTEQFLKDTHKQIEMLSAPYMNKSLRGFQKKIQDFERGIIPFVEWVKILKEHASEHLHIDLSNPYYQLESPMLLRLFTLNDYESKIDLSRLSEEKEAFIQAARRFTVVDPRVLEMFEIPFMSKQLSSPETGRVFEELANRLPANFDYSRYPNLNLFIGHLILYSEIESADLHHEIETLTKKISLALSENEREREIVVLLEDYRLLSKLLALQLIPAEYEKALGKGNALAPSYLIQKFLSVNTDGLVRDVKFSHVDLIEDLFDKALRFYAGAKERDQDMLNNLTSYIKERGLKKAVVITGGFHKEPFHDYFAGHPFNYALVTPRIENFDGHSLYEELILNYYQDDQKANRSTYRNIPYLATTPAEAEKLGVYGLRQLWRERITPALAAAYRSEHRSSDLKSRFSSLGILHRPAVSQGVKDLRDKSLLEKAYTEAASAIELLKTEKRISLSAEETEWLSGILNPSNPGNRKGREDLMRLLVVLNIDFEIVIAPLSDSLETPDSDPKAPEPAQPRVSPYDSLRLETPQIPEFILLAESIMHQYYTYGKVSGKTYVDFMKLWFKQKKWHQFSKPTARNIRSFNSYEKDLLKGARGEVLETIRQALRDVAAGVPESYFYDYFKNNQELLSRGDKIASIKIVHDLVQGLDLTNAEKEVLLTIYVISTARTINVSRGEQMDFEETKARVDALLDGLEEAAFLDPKLISYIRKRNQNAAPAQVTDADAVIVTADIIVTQGISELAQDWDVSVRTDKVAAALKMADAQTKQEAYKAEAPFRRLREVVATADGEFRTHQWRSNINPAAVRNKLFSVALLRHTASIHNRLVEEFGYQGQKVIYPLGGADVSTVLLATDAQEINIVDMIPFYGDMPKEIVETYRWIYFQDKSDDGFHSNYFLKLLNSASILIEWELQALGAVNIQIPQEKNAAGAYEISFEWSYDGVSDPVKRTILYYEKTLDLANLGAEPLLSEDWDLYFSKANFDLGLPQNIQLPRFIVSFQDIDAEGYEKHSMAEGVTLIKDDKYARVQNAVILKKTSPHRSELRTQVLSPSQRYEILEEFWIGRDHTRRQNRDGTLFVSTPLNVTAAIFREIEHVLGSLEGKKYFSLGAGSLTDSLAASALYGMNVTAAEKDARLSESLVETLAQAEKEEIVPSGSIQLYPQTDAFDLSWADQDVVYFFYTQAVDEPGRRGAVREAFENQLRQKVSEMKPGSFLAFLYTGSQLMAEQHEYELLQSLPYKVVQVSDAMTGLYLYLYQIPERSEQRSSFQQQWDDDIKSTQKLFERLSLTSQTYEENKSHYREAARLGMVWNERFKRIARHRKVYPGDEAVYEWMYESQKIYNTLAGFLINAAFDDRDAIRDKVFNDFDWALVASVEWAHAFNELSQVVIGELTRELPKINSDEWLFPETVSLKEEARRKEILNKLSDFVPSFNLFSFSLNEIKPALRKDISRFHHALAMRGIHDLTGLYTAFPEVNLLPPRAELRSDDANESSSDMPPSVYAFTLAEIPGFMHDLRNNLSGLSMYMEIVERNMPESTYEVEIFKKYRGLQQLLYPRRHEEDITLDDMAKFFEELMHMTSKESVYELKTLLSEHLAVDEELDESELDYQATLRDTVSNLLDDTWFVHLLAKSSLGLDDAKPEDVDVHAMLDRIVSLNSRLKEVAVKEFDAAHVLSTTGINGENVGVNLTLLTREISLLRVLRNLIGNAVYAVKDKGLDGRVSLKTDFSVDDFTYIIEIEDNGVGIAPENHEKIWQPYFTTKGKEGTGLGLDIVKKIVETELGGTISVESILGEGTTFRLVLPAKNPDADLNQDVLRPVGLLGRGIKFLNEDMYLEIREKGFLPPMLRDDNGGGIPSKYPDKVSFGLSPDNRFRGSALQDYGPVSFGSNDDSATDKHATFFLDTDYVFSHTDEFELIGRFFDMEDSPLRGDYEKGLVELGFDVKDVAGKHPKAFPDEIQSNQTPPEAIKGIIAGPALAAQIRIWDQKHGLKPLPIYLMTEITSETELTPWRDDEDASPGLSVYRQELRTQDQAQARRLKEFKRITKRIALSDEIVSPSLIRDEYAITLETEAVLKHAAGLHMRPYQLLNALIDLALEYSVWVVITNDDMTRWSPDTENYRSALVSAFGDPLRIFVKADSRDYDQETLYKIAGVYRDYLESEEAGDENEAAYQSSAGIALPSDPGTGRAAVYDQLEELLEDEHKRSELRTVDKQEPPAVIRYQGSREKMWARLVKQLGLEKVTKGGTTKVYQSSAYPDYFLKKKEIPEAEVFRIQAPWNTSSEYTDISAALAAVGLAVEEKRIYIELIGEPSKKPFETNMTWQKRVFALDSVWEAYPDRRTEFERVLRFFQRKLWRAGYFDADFKMGNLALYDRGENEKVVGLIDFDFVYKMPDTTDPNVIYRWLKDREIKHDGRLYLSPGEQFLTNFFYYENDASEQSIRRRAEFARDQNLREAIFPKEDAEALRSEISRIYTSVKRAFLRLRLTDEEKKAPPVEKVRSVQQVVLDAYGENQVMDKALRRLAQRISQVRQTGSDPNIVIPAAGARHEARDLKADDAREAAAHFKDVNILESFQSIFQGQARTEAISLLYNYPIHDLIHDFMILPVGSEEYDLTVLAMSLNQSLWAYKEVRKLYDQLDADSDSAKRRDTINILRTIQYYAIDIDADPGARYRVINRRTWENRGEGTYPLIERMLADLAGKYESLTLGDFAVSDGTSSYELAKHLHERGYAVKISGYDKYLQLHYLRMGQRYAVLDDAFQVLHIYDLNGKLLNTRAGSNNFTDIDDYMQQWRDIGFEKLRERGLLESVSLLNPEAEAYAAQHPERLSFKHHDVFEPLEENHQVIRVLGLLLRGEYSYFADDRIKEGLRALGQGLTNGGYLMNGTLWRHGQQIDSYQKTDAKLQYVDGLSDTAYSSDGWQEIDLRSELRLQASDLLSDRGFVTAAQEYRNLLVSSEVSDGKTLKEVVHTLTVHLKPFDSSEIRRNISPGLKKLIETEMPLLNALMNRAGQGELPRHIFDDLLQQQIITNGDFEINPYLIILLALVPSFEYTVVMDQKDESIFLGKLEDFFEKHGPKMGIKLADILNRNLHVSGVEDIRGVIHLVHDIPDRRKTARAVLTGQSELLARLNAEPNLARVRVSTFQTHIDDKYKYRAETSLLVATLLDELTQNYLLQYDDLSLYDLPQADRLMHEIIVLESFLTSA